MNEHLKGEKVTSSSLGKILRGNVYVISNNQYDSLQDGFIETKDYMYKTERMKDEIEIGKSLRIKLNRIKNIQRLVRKSTNKTKVYKLHNGILFVGFFIGIVFSFAQEVSFTSVYSPIWRMMFACSK